MAMTMRRCILVAWASLAAVWEAEGALAALFPPFCCFTFGSSEDFGLVFGGAKSGRVVVMDRVVGRRGRAS